MYRCVVEHYVPSKKRLHVSSYMVTGVQVQYFVFLYVAVVSELSRRSCPAMDLVRHCFSCTRNNV